MTKIVAKVQINDCQINKVYCFRISRKGYEGAIIYKKFIMQHQKVSINDYEKAFIQAMDCKKEDFGIRPYLENKDEKGPMLAKYGDRVYKIETMDSMYHYAEACLTDDLAMHLQPHIVTEIMEDAHTMTEFYDSLLPKLDKEQLVELNLMLNIYNVTKSDFWFLLYNHCEPLLYTAAINSATEIFDLEVLKGELVEELTSQGDKLLSIHRDGIFTEIVLDEDTPSQKWFWIYDTDVDF